MVQDRDPSFSRCWTGGRGLVSMSRATGLSSRTNLTPRDRHSTFNVQPWRRSVLGSHRYMVWLNERPRVVRSPTGRRPQRPARRHHGLNRHHPIRPNAQFNCPILIFG